MEDAFLQLEKEKLVLMKADNEMRNDADYNFLLSLLPHMKSMSELNNLKFRMETTKILMEIKQSEENRNQNTTISSRSQSSTPAVSWESFEHNVQENQDIPPEARALCDDDNVGYIPFNEF